ncbi:hypothetical protein Pyn_23526 [Prunus yedoensis var. nudiflora]|uniref:Uncharacterized protein n=1 Tax=Prunus yedoensis var. nudiflora TaxID=2094558 RepID=A0A314Z9Q9_PRUYE|nr:hypothetical protein Pyn_23526 [Prunus yedoensis var. nudiflora]
MEIVPVVPSFSGTFDTLVEAAFAESSPTMVSASSQDKASVSQDTSPLLPIIQHFLRRDLEPNLSPTLPAALWSKTFIFHGTLPTSSHIQPLLRIPEPSSPAPLPLIPFVDTATDEEALVNDIATKNIYAGHSSNTSWLEWESSFIAFKAFFDGGVQVLRSADDLLPLCHRFNGYATFRGALVYLEMVAALEKFMDKYGDFMDITGITSSFSRCAAFWTLGLVLHGMDTMQLLDITDHKLLCWQDAVCEAMTLGFWVDFLLNLMRDLARAVFGAGAIHSMKSFSGPDESRGPKF